jgi:hypothetical protein
MKDEIVRPLDDAKRKRDDCSDYKDLFKQEYVLTFPITIRLFF